KTQVRAGLGRVAELARCPLGPGCRVVAYFRRSEGGKHGLVCGMCGQQLPLQLGGQLRNGEDVRCESAGDFVAVVAALGSKTQVEQLRVRGRYLDAGIAERCRPLCHVVECVKRWLASRELGKEYAGSFHGVPPLISKQVEG